MHVTKDPTTSCNTRIIKRRTIGVSYNPIKNGRDLEDFSGNESFFRRVDVNIKELEDLEIFHGMTCTKACAISRQSNIRNDPRNIGFLGRHSDIKPSIIATKPDNVDNINDSRIDHKLALRVPTSLRRFKDIQNKVKIDSNLSDIL